MRTTIPTARWQQACAALALACWASVAFASEVHADASIDIQAPIGNVWNLLTTPTQWPQWYPAVDWVEVQGPLQIGTTFVWKSKGFTVKSTPTKLDINKELAWSGEAFGTHAQHQWVFTEHDGVVTVQTHETFSGWLPSLMPGTMQQTLNETLPNWLRALKAQAEKPM